MKLEKRVPSGREKNQESLKLLEELREQLYTSNVSLVRQSAFHLSWMQEDGLDILKEALFGDSHRRTKGAAGYGLRKMRGRMKKAGEQVLLEGLKRTDPVTVDVCKNAFLIIRKKTHSKRKAGRQRSQPPRLEIREIPQRPYQRGQLGKPRGPRNNFSKRR
jgi:hypothetical protein